ncbi:MAG: HIT family protein [Polyangiaceae bacterium]
MSALRDSPAVPCPFCSLAGTPLVYESERAVAFRDRYPVSNGHTLIIPRRHAVTYFDASAEEQAEIWRAVEVVKRDLDRELRPDGYNVGFNAGEAAGQTVMHLHVHVIPRFRGDMADPRGGVRGVIPDKQRY